MTTVFVVQVILQKTQSFNVIQTNLQLIGKGCKSTQDQDLQQLILHPSSISSVFPCIFVGRVSATPLSISHQGSRPTLTTRQIFQNICIFIYAQSEQDNQAWQLRPTGDILFSKEFNTNTVFQRDVQTNQLVSTFANPTFRKETIF